MTTTRREALVAAASLSVSALAFAAEPRRVPLEFGRRPLSVLIPSTVGAWSGEIDPSVVPESVDATLSDEQTLSRSYTNGAAAPIMMLIAYHSARSHELKVHRPETCYSVAGFTISALGPVSLPWRAGSAVPSVTFLGRREGRSEVVFYWTRVASSFPQSLSAQRMAFLRQALVGVRADGLLVRLSTIDTDIGAAHQRLTRFGADLLESSRGDGRRLLLGPAYPA